MCWGLYDLTVYVPWDPDVYLSSSAAVPGGCTCCFGRCVETRGSRMAGTTAAGDGPADLHSRLLAVIDGFIVSGSATLPLKDTAGNGATIVGRDAIVIRPLEVSISQLHSSKGLLTAHLLVRYICGSSALVYDAISIVLVVFTHPMVFVASVLFKNCYGSGWS